MGSNGKAWQNKGFREKCQKCEKGPRPGQRKRIDTSVKPKGAGKGKSKGPAGKGSGKSPDKSEFDKLVHTIAQLSKTVEGLAKSKASESSQHRMPSATGSIEEGSPAEQEGEKAEVDKLQARLKMDQDSIKHWKSCDDSSAAEESIKFHEGRIQATKDEIQRIKDQTATPAEQMLNLSGEAVRELQSRRSKATKLSKQLKEAEEEAKALQEQKATVEKAMAENAQMAKELQEESDKNNARLEQIAKATKGEVQIPPLDVFAFLTNAEHLQRAATEQLSKEGAEELKGIVASVAQFTAKLPGFIPQNLPVGAAEAADDDDMGDIFAPEDLKEAKQAASEAVAKAGSEADVEAVRCQAYHLKLTGIKKAKKGVLKTIAKASSG